MKKNLIKDNGYIWEILYIAFCDGFIINDKKKRVNYYYIFLNIGNVLGTFSFVL